LLCGGEVGKMLLLRLLTTIANDKNEPNKNKYRRL